jgi:hypothetical protein
LAARAVAVLVTRPAADSVVVTAWVPVQTTRPPGARSVGSAVSQVSDGRVGSPIVRSSSVTLPVLIAVIV